MCVEFTGHCLVYVGKVPLRALGRPDGGTPSQDTPEVLPVSWQQGGQGALGTPVAQTFPVASEHGGFELAGEGKTRLAKSACGELKLLHDLLCCKQSVWSIRLSFIFK